MAICTARRASALLLRGTAPAGVDALPQGEEALSGEPVL
jgi:hypothetical protein